MTTSAVVGNVTQRARSSERTRWGSKQQPSMCEHVPSDVLSSHPPHVRARTMSRAATVLVAWLGLWASTVAPVKGAFFSPSSLAASGVHPIDAALANSSCVVVFVPDASSNTDHVRDVEAAPCS